mmetsp:Transcript_26046/g.32506  ORF Transcript_26046/g.32506 Transcript_26046/m.32506 type:complete len:330 (-) Transcript_26046:138-1127(-)|eukprot:CAMPEP_0170465876 /NCGR_PEP_ID=MMETSP0123-20130129/10052_1 /TAXON_ID=182087 /ORGANISM="Favella ehrenbergii, Strain Fehren 1" /LENGTH=329 /DNA_ID=CAMNT_0010731875 /DNA_START=57 /DNA_END=1046 /DNA_ORIENTATION=-
MDPVSTLDFTISFPIDRYPVLAPRLPPSFVLTSIRPGKDSVAFSLIIDVFANVLAAVLPREVPLPMLLIVLPLAIVLPSVDPLVNAVAFHFILDELPAKLAAVGPVKVTFAMLLALPVVALEDGSVGPDFFSLPMVLVIDPESLVEGPINVRILAMAIATVLLPVAHVDVTVTVHDPPQPLLEVLYKIAFVAGAIWPDQRASAVALPIRSPLTRIAHLRRQSRFWLPLKHCLATCSYKLVTLRVVPNKGAESGKLFLDYQASVVGSVARKVRRLSRSQKLRRVLEHVAHQALSQEPSRASLQVHHFGYVHTRVQAIWYALDSPEIHLVV